MYLSLAIFVLLVICPFRKCQICPFGTNHQEHKYGHRRIALQFLTFLRLSPRKKRHTNISFHFTSCNIPSYSGYSRLKYGLSFLSNTSFGVFSVILVMDLARTLLACALCMHDTSAHYCQEKSKSGSLATRATKKIFPS